MDCRKWDFWLGALQNRYTNNYSIACTNNILFICRDASIIDLNVIVILVVRAGSKSKIPNTYLLKFVYSEKAKKLSKKSPTSDLIQ